MNLPTELESIKEEIKGYAKAYGLDFYETIFEILTFEQLNEVAAYMGFPTRYPHWKFGMEYTQLEKGYAYGLQKIYEMVVNNDPCYAYLLECNNMVDQKIVIAHVYAHCDFFKNNYYYSKTNRKMINEMANHGNLVRKYIDKYGLNKVEAFLDTCLSLEDLIDHHSPYISRSKQVQAKTFKDDEEEIKTVKKLKSKKYMDAYINPPAFIQQQRKELEEEAQKKTKFPSEPQKDILQFLLDNASLERWQGDILNIIREESYYFAPQGMTKIMNEGWASYWHSKIMTEKILEASEVIDYADHHSGTLGVRPGRINPYKLGFEIYKDIEERWNKGRFGLEWERCDSMEEKLNWDKKTGLGREKIFAVRKIFNDIGFIDTFLTDDFCEKQKLFTYKFNPNTGYYEIADRDFTKIKQKLLFSLTNFGRPFIFIEDANYKNRGELHLKHRHEGLDLRLNYARDTMANIFKIWKRPIHLDTVFEGNRCFLSFDGEKHSILSTKGGPDRSTLGTHAA